MKKDKPAPNPNNIDPNLIVKGTIVKVKSELSFKGEFTARAIVVSKEDLRGVVGNRHPTFKLLEPVKGLKNGHEFWGTISDILEIIECPKP